MVHPLILVPPIKSISTRFVQLAQDYSKSALDQLNKLTQKIIPLFSR